MPAGNAAGVVVGDVGMELLNRRDHVSFHDLHVVDVVEQLEVLRADPLAQFDTPYSVVAHVVRVVDLAVEQFHHGEDLVFLADRHDALEADRALVESLLVWHPGAVAGKADDVPEPRCRHFRRRVLEEGDDLVVILQTVQPGRDPAGNAADHRADEVVLLQRVEVLHLEQLDGREPHRLALAAQVLETDFRITPFADRLANAALELRAGGGFGGRKAFGQRGGGRRQEGRAARGMAQHSTTGHRCRHNHPLLFVGNHTKLPAHEPAFELVANIKPRTIVDLMDVSSKDALSSQTPVLGSRSANSGTRCAH